MVKLEKLFQFSNGRHTDRVRSKARRPEGARYRGEQTIGKMAFSLSLERSLLIENQQGFKAVVTLRLERPLGQVSLVRGEGSKVDSNQRSKAHQ